MRDWALARAEQRVGDYLAATGNPLAIVPALRPDPSTTPVTGRLVVLVHGLGGSADSPYLCAAATVAAGLGLDSLRLNLRGADPVARDFYHGGLTAELHAAIADRARRVFRAWDESGP